MKYHFIKKKTSQLTKPTKNYQKYNKKITPLFRSSVAIIYGINMEYNEHLMLNFLFILHFLVWKIGVKFMVSIHSSFKFKIPFENKNINL